MVESFILIKGSVEEEKFRFSLSNAKQIVVGRVAGTQTIVHLAAMTAKDLSNAIQEFAQIEGVKEITTLTVRNT
jgi:hypothetical protein